MEQVLQGWLIKSPPEKKSFGTWKIFGAVKFIFGKTVIIQLVAAYVLLEAQFDDSEFTEATRILVA